MIKIADNFQYQGRKPLDSRLIAHTITDMTALPESIIYNGILVFNEETEKYYTFKINNTVDPILGKWEEAQMRSSSIEDTHSVEYKQGEHYKKGNLIVLNGRLYIALNDFVSDSDKLDVEDSLETDLATGNLKSVYVDIDTNCKEYQQNCTYKTTNLVKYNNQLYLVKADFISDNTTTNADDSFLLDLQNENLIPVTEKSNAQILEYFQATDYKKNNLVCLKKSIAKVEQDFTSNATEPTVEESFDVDKTLGNISLINIGEVTVQEYLRDTDYLKNTLVFSGDKIARVEQDYHSSTLSIFSFECFEDDIKNGYLILINTDHINIMNQYAQNNMYFKDTLVYYNNLITRVVNDFISDSDSTNTIDDSFDIDIAAGNLLILNKEAEPGIKPYKQGTFFYKDKLVFADGRIGRVLNDYISDNTGSTLEESINIDIANGNLREMAENYKFKLYKTTQDMDKTIDAINELPIGTIIFENGETIANMHINEAVYGPLGTLALIKEIDFNNKIIKAKTVNSREMEFMPPAPNLYNYEIALEGAGYSVGEILPTNLSNVNIEIAEVGVSGNITSVKSTSEPNANASGAGALINATIKFYVGNGKQWYEIPKNEVESIVKKYKQGEFYKAETLIYFKDILTIATLDFTADNILPTVEDSFNFDKDNGNIIRLTREDICVPECLGSVKTDTSTDLPAIAIKGNWVLIEDCMNTAPGQAGIGLYNGTSWDINPIPQGTFQFPEPTDDRNLYFRKREIGNSNGSWEAFTKVDGSEVEIILNSKNDLIDNAYIPKNNELVWDSNRKILVIGDGITSLGGLKEFYSKSISSADILAAIGYTPEDSANKGQANGYAPLDANSKVPASNLPDSLTDTYSKTEIDNKDTATLNAVTTLVNTEATRAKGVEDRLRIDLDTHISDTAIHTTQSEKDAWNAKIDKSDLDDYENHINDTDIHVTQADKDKWNGMSNAYFVLQVSDLPQTDINIGSMGYVQTSAAGVTPITCDQYIYDGTAWQPYDAGQVSLQFNWGNIQGRPASSALTLDNAVTVAHSHNNKLVLDKIGQSATGNFTYDGVEIGVRVSFLDNENLLPPVGTEDTLYVIYEDARVRNYPSISIWRNGSYQMLGRGIQESAPVVGDMNILQSEYYSVVKDSTYIITVTQNQFFAFTPVEILKEIEGLKNQEKQIIIVDDPTKFNYNKDLLDISESSRLTISIKEKETELDTVSDFYYSHVDIDLSDYKDIDNIG